MTKIIIFGAALFLLLANIAIAQNNQCNYDGICNNNETAETCIVDCGEGSCVVNAEDFYCDRSCPGDPDCDFETGIDLIGGPIEDEATVEKGPAISEYVNIRVIIIAVIVIIALYVLLRLSIKEVRRKK